MVAALRITALGLVVVAVGVYDFLLLREPGGDPEAVGEWATVDYGV